MFLVVFVDVLGFTIVIPLLAIYAEKFGASPLVATLIVTCYAACSLISTPILGRLSDRYGRRPLLIISQAGTCAGFLLLGYSTSLWMVFAGRVLDGITAGNLSLAQAYISDHTKPENRAKAFGVIGIAFGIGFMFGPALGGWLGHYGLHLPFLVAAGLSLLAMICTYALLPREENRTLQPNTDGPGGRRPGLLDVDTYASYFRRPELRSLYVQFFLFSFAFSVFTSGIALFAERRFLIEKVVDGTSMLVPWGAREVGYLFAFSGVLGILWQGGLIGRLVKKYGEVRLVLAGFVASVAGYVGLGFVPEDQLLPLGLVAVVSSFGSGVLRPVLTSRITKAVGPHEQGVAIGISGSLSSLAMMLAPPAGGVMLDHHWLLAWALVPAAVSALGLLFALFVGSRAAGAAQPTA
jgi:DHA1 family tetracycline resistance protein-like MFS transporter